jgi:hypothetical protein
MADGVQGIIFLRIPGQNLPVFLQSEGRNPFPEGGHDEGEGPIELGVHDQIGDLIEDGLKKNFRKKS